MAKLDYQTGHWGSGPPSGVLDAIKEADKLRFHSVRTPYGGGPAAFPVARDAVRGIDDPVGSLGCPGSNFRERILTNRPFMVTTLFPPPIAPSTRAHPT